MARNIDRRLEHLRTRRQGLDRLNRLAMDARNEVLAKSRVAEAWQTRATTQPYTRYALGAMQEVGPDYTRISKETAERVGNQLANSISDVEFELQGSVPLNVHIRGVSDVDLLTLDTSFLVYANTGIRGMNGGYTATDKTSASVLAGLRRNVERVLPLSFPAASVDVSGGKAVNITGGSLARPVDVVPSHWFDTVDYQRSGQLHDRGVYIYNKKNGETISNFPFMHIKRVTDRCNDSLGGLRKAIRLCKNVKADAIEDGTPIALPSFDIAATMYHADVQALRLGSVYELRILAETQRHLEYLSRNEDIARTLEVPDRTRAIFDTREKLEGLKKLSAEIDDLVREVAKEQKPALLMEQFPALHSSREFISGLRIN